MKQIIRYKKNLSCLWLGWTSILQWIVSGDSHRVRDGIVGRPCLPISLCRLTGCAGVLSELLLGPCWEERDSIASCSLSSPY